MNAAEVKQLVLDTLQELGMVLRVEVPAAEVIRKSYQGAAVVRIMEKIGELGPDEREAFRFIMSRDAFVTVGELSKVISGYQGGAAQVKWGTATKNLVTAGMVVKGGSGNTGFKVNLRESLAEQLAIHRPTGEEIEQVYQAVLGRIAGEVQQ